MGFLIPALLRRSFPVFRGGLFPRYQVCACRRQSVWIAVRPLAQFCSPVRHVQELRSTLPTFFLLRVVPFSVRASHLNPPTNFTRGMVKGRCKGQSVGGLDLGGLLPKGASFITHLFGFARILSYRAVGGGQ